MVGGKQQVPSELGKDIGVEGIREKGRRAQSSRAIERRELGMRNLKSEK